MNIKMPDEVQYIINTLQAHGHEAYVVGGCVRDSLLGKEPKDWDICTPSLPEQTVKYFEGCRVIETGLRHGTVTLMLGGMPFEITTYRIDGEYTDNRRPDQVKFVSSLREDLSRRDFTVNAMAYNPEMGIVDFFDGLGDLNAGIIKCVGDPDKRFREDALRIMRALRFASVLSYSIDRETAAAMHDNRGRLKNIAAERIASELNKLITGSGVRGVLSEHLPVVFEIIPELAPAAGFEQNNPHHCHDVLGHILHSVENAPVDVVVRLAMLFHDIAKPGCYTESDGVGHFYGHPKISSDMAGRILSRLKYDNHTLEAVVLLVLHHDREIPPVPKSVKRWMNKIGEERFAQLIEAKKADAMAQSPDHRAKKLEILNKISGLAEQIIKQQQCFSLKDLAVNGRDLMAAGVSEGEQIGVMLNCLLDMVIDGQVENDKTELLRTTRKIIGCDAIGALQTNGRPGTVSPTDL